MGKEYGSTIEYLKDAREGSMGYQKYSEDGFNWRVGFFIKEATKYIKRLGYNPSVEIRMGFRVINGVMLVPLLVRFNMDDDMIYETWLNYHTDMCKEAFEYLSKQDTINFPFLNENMENLRNIAIKNEIQEEFVEIKQRILSLKPWSTEMYSKAQNELFKKYPSVKELFNAMTYK